MHSKEDGFEGRYGGVMGGERWKEESHGSMIQSEQDSSVKVCELREAVRSTLSRHIFHAQITQIICSCPNSKDLLGLLASLCVTLLMSIKTRVTGHVTSFFSLLY